jgi:peroxiredoxin
MPSYEEDLSEFERLDAQVLGISVDNVPSNEAWAKSMGGLSYPLLSDFFPHGLVALKYNSLRDSGVTERSVFVVDKQGKVAYIDIHDITKQPPTDKIFEALKKLQK